MQSKNKYRIGFQARCPSDGLLIDYSLEITTTGRVILAEDLQDWANSQSGPSYHENLADRAWLCFGGFHRMTAIHQGVAIETIRQGDPLPKSEAE